MNLDAVIDSALAPIADKVSGLIFSYVVIGEVKVEFLVLLLISAALFFTFRTGFIGLWNSYEALLIYLPSYPTLAVGMYQVSENYVGKEPVYYAAMIVSLIPVVAIFIAFSDLIMNNMSIGGLKG